MQTGQYDPYSDDSRLAIQKLSFCTNTDTLIIAGTAGQVLTFQLTSEPVDVNLTVGFYLLINFEIEFFSFF